MLAGNQKSLDRPARSCPAHERRFAGNAPGIAVKVLCAAYDAQCPYFRLERLGEPDSRSSHERVISTWARHVRPLLEAVAEHRVLLSLAGRRGTGAAQRSTHSNT